MKIPKLGGGKAIVIRADDKTGKVLNNDGSYYNSEGENYYMVMESISDAKAYAVKEVKKGMVEILIFDGEGEFIETHRPK